MTTSQEERAALIRKVGSLIVEKHVDPANLHRDYGPWKKSLDERAPELIKGSEEDFERGIAAALRELGTSHLAFIRGVNPGVPATFALNASLMPINRAWIFTDLVEDGPAWRAGIKPGEVLITVNGVMVDPGVAPLFELGRRHTLTLEHRDVTVELPNPRAKDRPPMIEPKAVSHRMYPDGVGYLRVAYFPGAVGLSFIAKLEAAIQDLASKGAQRFVVDLRGNPGGGLGSLRLMSLLTPERVPVGYSLTRKAIRRKLKKEDLPCIDRIPRTKLQQLMMALRFKVLNRDRSIALATEGLGSPLVGKTVLLVNEQTKSAAEMVAAFCHERGLATLVGSKTPGEVLGAVNFKLPGGYRLRMPIAGWYTWGGAEIEGHGVAPHHDLALSPEALKNAVDSQLVAAMECSPAKAVGASQK